MADITELESALVKADAAGDTEGARVLAGEVSKMRGAPTMQTLPSMTDSIKQELVGRLDWEKNLAGVGSAVDTAWMRLKQLFGGTLDPQQTANVQANRDLNAASGQVQAGNIAGNLMMTGAPAASLYRGATALAGAALPRVAAALAPTVGGAVTGATIAGLTEPTLPGESTTTNMEYGAAGGALGDTAARGMARVAQPIMQSPAVQTLLGQGIVPTPGQAAGGIAKSMESRLSSVPLLGDVIKWGSNRSANEVNLAVIKTVAPDATTIGRDGVQFAQKAASEAYDTALSKFTVVPDMKFIGEANKIANDSTHLLTEDQRKMFNGFVQSRIVEPLRRGPQVMPPTGNNIVNPQTGAPFNYSSGPSAPVASGQIAKEIDSEIGSQAIGYMKSQSQSEKNFGQALFKLQGEWRDLIERNAPPGVAAEVRAANQKWANLTILERAAAKSGTDNGVFTVAQLQQAVRESDPTIRKRAFAAGNVRGQELSDAAKTVIGQGYPDSGTAGRYLAAHALLGGAGAIAGQTSGYGAEKGGAAGVAIPLVLGALASTAYSRAGSRYMLGDLLRNVQPATAELARKGAPYAANAGATLADLLRQRQQ